eukprot:Phypoly_transcript_07339.p1 GENE.Phypoly_transcript_07339~~Phypoly_transcript_07339.p1  ORF type:complete len:472 (+),score=70.46 Phypoly_transcript_07339:109-1416(+)
MNVSEFYAMPVTDPWNYPLIDLHTFFYNNVTKYTFGLSDYTPDAGSRFDDATGPYVPMFTSMSTVGSTLASVQSIQIPELDGVFDFDGFLSYALRVDDRNISNGDIVTFFAGFVAVDAMTVNFTLTKTHYNPTPNQFDPRNQNFWYYPTDVWSIYSNHFTAFSNIFKPWIHYLPYYGPLNHTYVVVVDPNTRTVYGIDTDNPNSVISEFPFLGNQGFANMELVSTTFDGRSQTLIVGLAASGFAPGKISVFNFATTPSYVIPTPTNFTLQQNYSNPKALASDSQYLYIGFNGYTEVIQISLTNFSTVGYQRLPEYLHRAWDAVDRHDHVYFVTYEQNAKVFRVAKQDFCPASCPYNGYCTAGKCVCSMGFVMNHEKNACLLQAAREVITIQHHYVTAHDGEVTLGIFFALSFIAAAAGWFMWWRGRNSSYQAINH